MGVGRGQSGCVERDLMWRPQSLAEEGPKGRLTTPLFRAKLRNWRIEGREHWLPLLALPLICSVAWQDVATLGLSILICKGGSFI